MIDLRYGRDCVESLRELPDASVHCCVTSPPYYRLRDYGVDGQIGLEGTVDEFLDRLWAVFDEVRRVLHPSGSCWVNIGDSYASNGGGGGGSSRQNLATWSGNTRGGGKKASSHNCGRAGCSDVRPKSLLMVPSRFALGMQARGWILRDFIVWHKPAPMPESVQDRCTKAWEPVFMFSKEERYYADMVAVKQPLKEESKKHEDAKSCRAEDMPDGSNLRNVWTMASEGYDGKHYATFPTELPRRCILIGTSANGVCPECLAPWKRSGNGWEPTCKCGRPDTIAARVLDPFSGTATTGQVAFSLGRDYIGLDLSTEYLDLARERCGGLFCSQGA